MPYNEDEMVRATVARFNEWKKEPEAQREDWAVVVLRFWSENGFEDDDPLTIDKRSLSVVRS